MFFAYISQNDAACVKSSVVRKNVRVPSSLLCRHEVIDSVCPRAITCLFHRISSQFKINLECTAGNKDLIVMP